MTFVRERPKCVYPFICINKMDSTPDQSFTFHSLEAPPPKRRRLQSALPTNIHHCGTVSEIVLKLCEPIRKFLNVNEVLYKTLLSPHICFLRAEERMKVWKWCNLNKPPGEIASRILSLLDARDESVEKENDFCRFVACVVKDDNHRGHRELTKIFQKKLNPSQCQFCIERWKRILEIIKKAHNSRSTISGARVSDIVLCLSDDIRRFLNVREVLHNISHDISFLRPKEREPIWNLLDEGKSDSEVIARILSMLDARDDSIRDDDFHRFVACIVKDKQDIGHHELTSVFKKHLKRNDWVQIQNIIEKARMSPLPSPYVTPAPSPSPQEPLSPEKPVPLITLQGQLIQREFLEKERELWFAFSTENYEHLSVLTKDIRLLVLNGKFNQDCQIVAMWFESLILMHRDGKYNDAIKQLQEAESLAKCNCENETILLGRIHQRMAQIFLMKQDGKTNATKYFKMAKEELQFVGRGYDKANMYCREAKILSATESTDRRDEIEEVYEKALGTLEKDDPYFLASFPSVSLSKAAFHLDVAFGAEVPRETFVSPRDIKKAKDTLKNVDEKEHILIEMRRKEYKFLQAEMCRWDRNIPEARLRFQSIINSGDSKTENIMALSRHRLEIMAHCTSL